MLFAFQAARKSGVLLRGAVAALSALPRVSRSVHGVRAGWGAAVATARPPGGGAGTGHQQPVAAGRSARGSAAERAQGTSSPQRRSCCAQRPAAAGQHRGGRRTAPGSAANATHLDRRGLSPSLAPAPRRGRAATASIAGRRPAHSSNVHRDRARAVGRVAVGRVDPGSQNLFSPVSEGGLIFSGNCHN